MVKIYYVGIGVGDYVSKDLKITNKKSDAFVTNQKSKAIEVADFLMSKNVKNIRVFTKNL